MFVNFWVLNPRQKLGREKRNHIRDKGAISDVVVGDILERCHRQQGLGVLERREELQKDFQSKEKLTPLRDGPAGRTCLLNPKRNDTQV